MKNTMKAFLVMGSLHLVAAEQDIKALGDPLNHSYFLSVDGKIPGLSPTFEGWLDIELSLKLSECLGDADIPAFEKLEKECNEKGHSLYRLRRGGFSLLQEVIEFHKEAGVECFASTTREQSDAFVKYILERVSAEDLNGIVPTSWRRNSGIYYGTAAAFAACKSPSCLKMILADPRFNPENFVKSHPTKFWQQVYQSITPVGCIMFLKEEKERVSMDSRYNSSACRMPYFDELIGILTEKYEQQQ